MHSACLLNQPTDVVCPSDMGTTEIMGNRRHGARRLLDRAQAAVVRIRTPRAVPAKDATLTSMLEAPHATLGVSPKERKAIAEATGRGRH